MQRLLLVALAAALRADEECLDSLAAQEPASIDWDGLHAKLAEMEAVGCGACELNSRDEHGCIKCPLTEVCIKDCVGPMETDGMCYEQHALVAAHMMGATALQLAAWS